MIRRQVLKLSGEALASSASDETIDASVVDYLAKEIAHSMESETLQLAVVVGGGNIWRGATGAMAGMNRANSDQMGTVSYTHLDVYKRQVARRRCVVTSLGCTSEITWQ